MLLVFFCDNGAQENSIACTFIPYVMKWLDEK